MAEHATDETDEYDDAAEGLTERAASLGWNERVALACRGSANPAALAWLAEGTGIGLGDVVLDLGAGLGGPAAWVARRYGSVVIGMDPSTPSAVGMRDLLDVPSIVGDGGAVPVRDRSVHTALLLGVVSVVPDPLRTVRESRRIASNLGLLDYCATGSTDLSVGGSVFPTPSRLTDTVETAGWRIVGATDIDLVSPPTWQGAIERHGADDASPDELAVRTAIERNDIAPRMLIAS